MKDLSLPLKIIFVIFILSLIIASIAFNLERKKLFFISLIIVLLSAGVLLFLLEKQDWSVLFILYTKY